MAPEVKIDPSIDMKTPPKVKVDTMKAGPFFAYAAEMLKLHSRTSLMSRSSHG